MAEKEIITVENLKKSYGDLVVLENINFSVKKGEIFLICGGSGCGKSTLLKQMIGLETPDEGTVYIDGDDFTHAGPDEQKLFIQKFGVLFQLGGLFASMTIAENLGLALEKYTDLPQKRIDELIELKLKSVGLSGLQNRYPSELSGGMKKRAALARAMVLDPDILFFDEPSTGLDPITSAALDELIKQLNTGLNTTMVIVTHDLQSILSIAHRVLMLDKDETGILAMGTIDELKNMKEEPRVYNFFNRKANL
ncbi:MAG: ABC transporter ATP-binding protein [Bacteroidota bacterium]